MEDGKAALRAKAAAARAAIPAAERARVAREVARRFVQAFDIVSGVVVSLYWPVKGELDTHPLMEALIDRGARVALPVVARPGQPLMFRAWHPGEPLVDGRYSIKAPPERAPALRPDIVGVPLLAFDETGHRLGYGGGYYDRTLAALRADGGAPAVAVGLAFERQRMGWLPRHGGDQGLDMIITEHAVHRVAADIEEF